MKKNLKFLLTAIISIISLSAVTTSAMQNNPNDDDNTGGGYKNYNLNTIFKNYEQMVKNQEQNANQDQDSNLYNPKKEAEKANEKRFENIKRIEAKIKKDKNNGCVFQFNQSQIQEHLGINFNLNTQQQNNNFDNKKKEDEKNK